ncbi:MAG: hypothetical protein IPM94_14915 [bacterium]|nr:hypothetical protein [bacterium]
MSLRFAAGSLVDTLDRTMGHPTGLRLTPAGAPWDPASAPGGAWRIPLLDDGGEEAGAVVADLGAVVLLGGWLIMLPPGSMQEQIAAGQPSEQVREAYAEVVNVLRGEINNTGLNPHVVPGPLAPYEDGPAWQAAPANRLDLHAETGFVTIRIAFLGR